MDTQHQREAHAKTQGTGEWEPVTTPIDCDYYAVNKASSGDPNFDKCSDPGDAETCNSGMSQFAVIAPNVSSGAIANPEPRWAKGEVITYVRSSTALYLYFLR